MIDNAINTENSIDEYETLTSDLLEWIEQTIVILKDRQFANSLTGVQQQLAAFNTYRIVEKPPKYVGTFPSFLQVRGLVCVCVWGGGGLIWYDINAKCWINVAQGISFWSQGVL